jgi:hypothetical protein
MPKKIKEVVIGKEEAVFWLDKNGCWNNENGKFRHNKIIRYFHSCIRRDGQGYFLYQENANYVEKVYFPYEDQALFVFDVIEQEAIMLLLNTKQRIKLKPRKLFTNNDCLYMKMGEETIKFAEHGLVKIARYLEEKSDQLYIRIKSRRYKIPAIEDLSASG